MSPPAPCNSQRTAIDRQNLASIGDIAPDRDTFDKLYEADRPQVVWTSTVADLETPVSAYLKLADQAKNSFLLESVEGGESRGRYSIIGLAPDLIWRFDGPAAAINRTPDQDINAFEAASGPPLDSLRAVLQESLIDLPDGLPPMAAGMVGFMGYDMVRQMEHLPRQNPDALDLPTALFIRPTIMAIFDNVTDLITLVTPVRPAANGAPGTAYQAAIERLTSMLDRLSAPLPRSHQSVSAHQKPDEMPVSNTPRERYMDMVRQAQDYILAGDIFQVVLSQRFSRPFDLPPFSLYRALRRTNPSPFLFFLSFDGFSLVGSSPEILVRLRDEEVTVRPIAGTRRRGKTREQDEALEAELLADPKELAEHLMLLDLGRNDVGRVAKAGTVKVTEQNMVERYSHVMHIVSNVTGILDATSHDAIGALEAGFPAGTVSGAPKIRAMEIIDELELEARGPYAGGVGYFSANGSMDTCIVLRTGLIKDGMLHVQAGAGVVADSVPENEQAECENKAQALFKAAQEAVRFATKRQN